LDQLAFIAASIVSWLVFIGILNFSWLASIFLGQPPH
jgi:hypothetical protein